MQNITAKIVHVQLEEDNRFYAEAEIVVPDKFEHIELFIDNICPEAHAPPLSDVQAGTHRLSISGERQLIF
jgi:hypothetical protein